MKPYNELTIQDDFLFCKVMSIPHLCRHMIEILLDIEVDHIEFVTKQHMIAPEYDRRSIRLDVYVKNSDKIFDVEMQTTDKKNIEKRVRYYQALMDLEQLEHQSDFKKLKPTYVIFICSFDPFGMDLLSYTVQQTFIEKNVVHYDDNTNKVFYNLTASELKNKHSELGNFLRYLNSSKPNDSFTNEIDSAVTEAKFNTNWRKEYMTVNMLLLEEHIKAFEEGAAQQKLRSAVIAVEKFHLPVSDVAREYDVDLSELEKQLEHPAV